MGTEFSAVYDCFLGKITDDMYMELTLEDTMRDLQSMLLSAIPGFEFPRKNLGDYSLVSDSTGADISYFNNDLTAEEINILAILMMEKWLQRQVTSIEVTRMKFSGSDFKFTSQANHLGKLLAALSEVQRQSHHYQRLYKRRKIDNSTGNYISNWSIFGKEDK